MEEGLAMEVCYKDTDHAGAVGLQDRKTVGLPAATILLTEDSPLLVSCLLPGTRNILLFLQSYPQNPAQSWRSVSRHRENVWTNE